MMTNQPKNKRFSSGRIMMYILIPIVFLFLGASASSFLGAADDQGLAGGAIVLFYGLISALTVLIIALLFSTLLSSTTIRKINLILSFLVLLILLWLFWRLTE